MPAASVCDPVTLSLKRSFESSSSIDDSSVNLSLSSSRILQAESVEYEESEDYRRLTNFDRLKSKYTVMNVPNCENSEERKESVYSKKEAKSSKPALPEPVVTLYPAHKVKLGWKNDYPVGAGMYNVGNTCYLNSTLQALFHVPALVNWLLYDSHYRAKCEQNDGGGECLICAMAKTLQFSHQKSDESIKPFYIYNKLKQICRTMVLGQQEDAHEFLRYLLEGMERAFLGSQQTKSMKLDSYSKETTPVNQIFGGYIRTEVKCLQCRHVSTTFQHFQDLLVDIRKATSLDEALTSYFSQEQLDNNDYKCEACKRRVPATKQFSLEKPPKVLCVQLKRFSVLGGKIQRHIGFKQTVDMGPYLWKESGEPRRKLIYRLTSMVTHMGPNVNCGHYTAVAQVSSGKYYCFDDSYVRPISLSNVLNTNAYIMIFEMEPQVENGQPSTPKMNGAQNKTLLSTPKHITPKPVLITNSKKDQSNSQKSATPRQNFIGPQLPKHMQHLENGKGSSNGNSLVPYDGSSDEEEVKETNGKSNGVSGDSRLSSPKTPRNGVSSVQHSTPHENGDCKLEKSRSNGEKMSNGVSNGTKYQNGNSENGEKDSNGDKWKDKDRTKYEERAVTKAASTSKSWHVSDTSPPVSTSGPSNGWTVTDTKDELKKSNSHPTSPHAAASRSFDGTNRSDTVERLSKFSHRGYGDSNVKSWNGNPSYFAREVDNESRFERKRHLLDDDADLDKGRMKKMKTSHDRSDRLSSNGYNHFQAVQSNKNWNQRYRFQNNYRSKRNNQRRFNRSYPQYNYRKNNHHNNSHYHDSRHR